MRSGNPQSSANTFFDRFGHFPFAATRMLLPGGGAGGGGDETTGEAEYDNGFNDGFL